MARTISGALFVRAARNGTSNLDGSTSHTLDARHHTDIGINRDTETAFVSRTNFRLK